MGLTAAMFVTPFVISIGVIHLLYAVLFKSLFRKQNRRYFFVVVGQAIFIAWGAFLLSRGSIDDISANANEWMRSNKYGGVVALCACLIVVSPIMSALAAYRIRRRPCRQP